MIDVFELLMAASMIGAVDVLYYHLYRFRLFERADSVKEEVTHLLRHVLFLLIVAVVMFARAEPWAIHLLLGLFLADLLNSAADVLLERRSRASLGGLPSGEYLLHIVGSVMTGAVVATAWWRQGDAGSLSELEWARGWLTLGLGGALLVLETALFRAALVRRGRGVREPGPASLAPS